MVLLSSCGVKDVLVFTSDHDNVVTVHALCKRQLCFHNTDHVGKSGYSLV